MNTSYAEKKWAEKRKCQDFERVVCEKYLEEILKYRRNRQRKYMDRSHIVEVLPNCWQFQRSTDFGSRLANVSENTVKCDLDLLNNYGDEQETVLPIISKIMDGWHIMDTFSYLKNPRIDPFLKKWLLDFMDELGYGKFAPWVMINISPKWNNIDQINWKKQSMFLKQIIVNRFKKWERYVDKMEMVLEPGKQGDHLHAHILMRCSKSFNEKSFRTWINKGNLVQQFRAEFVEPRSQENRCKGFEGDVSSRYSFQTKMVLNEEIYMDTLNYLSEEHKTEDHQNDFSIMPFLPLRVSL